MRGWLCRELFVGRGEIANPDTKPWELLEFASSLQPTGLRPICLIYRYVIHELSQCSPGGPPAVQRDRPGPAQPGCGAHAHDLQAALFSDQRRNLRPGTAGAGSTGRQYGGGTTLIRFLNGGLMSHVPVLQGPYMRVVAEDGNPTPIRGSSIPCCWRREKPGMPCGRRWSPASTPCMTAAWH